MKYSQSLNRGAVFLSFIYFCVFIFIYETFCPGRFTQFADTM